jgi:ligand-binding sensor domain-containing protein
MAVSAYAAPTAGMPGGNIRAISVDPQGAVWAGTQKGVVRIGDRVQVSTALGMPSGLITALEHDHQTCGSAPSRASACCAATTCSRSTWHRWAGAAVFGFHQLGDAMWISSDRGLYRWRDGKLARVGLEQGMPVDAVFQLVPDRLGNVWISSNRGVLRTAWPPSTPWPAGAVVERYNEIDGMANAQANGSSGPSAILRQDGTFWVVTAEARHRRPQRLQRFRERPSPPAAIERAGGWRTRALGGPDRNYIPSGRRLAVRVMWA